MKHVDYVAVTSNNWARTIQPNYGAYATQGNQWIGYNDISTIKTKAEYIVSNKYGGAAVWTMDMDDFNNECCHGENPLLNTLSIALRGVGQVTEGNCVQPVPVTTPAPPESTTGFLDNGLTGTTTSKPTPVKTTTTKTTTATTTTKTKPATKPATTPKPHKPVVLPIELDEEESTGRYESGDYCQKDGEYFFHPSCNQFFRCVNRKIVLQKCAAGLLWNHPVKRCDWPAQVSCGKRTSKF
jgi:chitinase